MHYANLQGDKAPESPVRQTHTLASSPPNSHISIALSIRVFVKAHSLSAINPVILCKHARSLKQSEYTLGSGEISFSFKSTSQTHKSWS